MTSGLRLCHLDHCPGYLECLFTKLTVWSFSIRMVVCHFTFNRERSGRNFTLSIKKKPRAYEKNMPRLPNTLREATWKTFCR